MTNITRRRAIAALTLAIAGTTVAAALVPSAAAYRDDAYARTDAIGVVATPPFAPGLSRNSRMVDTGLGLSSAGNVYVWGLTSLNINGGAANPGGQQSPQQVPFPTGTTISQVSGMIYDVNALDAMGQVWGWGSDNTRNGTDTTRPSGAPQRLRIGTAWNGAGALLDSVVALSSTETAGAGIRSDGTVWHWGASTGYGGNSGAGASQLAGLPDPSVAGQRPVYLKGAYTNFFVILENGDVYYWGGVGGSSLPPGTPNAGATATKLTALSPWMKANVAAGAPYIVAVDGGINMGAALLSDGTVLSWGSSASRTGRGAPTSPALVPTLSGVVSMQFGYTGVVLLDGQSRLWGYGAADDYGNNPLLPAILDTNIAQYAAGQGYYLWQRQDGTFWGRGYNPQGAIGLPVGTQGANRQILFSGQNALEVVAQ
ncbi:hypothetical protein [Microbacterium sp. SORGH_AS_0862]|uniref:hypothetical protein n=1 Tax=Microbacterium sp. SORGH_AS_0862 TaxID=3041789 RepID=UPI00278EF734|nr:hypothetical protein [Microbacterium sp. SORGH_AS_0862]MDQ1205230.1 alpha-tubulin suppressor-like RCC1 family protein [Microbacterium sp. SORGH_AS_0862]